MTLSPATLAELLARLSAWAALVNENVTAPLPVSDAFREEHREKGALLVEAATAIESLAAEVLRLSGEVETADWQRKAAVSIMRLPPPDSIAGAIAHREKIISILARHTPGLDAWQRAIEAAAKPLTEKQSTMFCGMIERMLKHHMEGSLVHRYMQHVVNNEGAAYVGDDQDAELRKMFSAKEIIILRQLGREIDAPDAASALANPDGGEKTP